MQKSTKECKKLCCFCFNGYSNGKKKPCGEDNFIILLELEEDGLFLLEEWALLFLEPQLLSQSLI